MKKTLVITALCAITALFSGCWKKKDKTDTMNSAMSTDAVMSDDKPIKVAALSGMSPGGNADMIGGMSTGPSDQNKLGENTNDKQAIDELKKKEEKAEKANKKAEKAEKEAEKAEEEAEKAEEEAEKAEEEADDSENEGDEKKK